MSKRRTPIDILSDIRPPAKASLTTDSQSQPDSELAKQSNVNPVSQPDDLPARRLSDVATDPNLFAATGRNQKQKVTVYLMEDTDDEMASVVNSLKILISKLRSKKMKRLVSKSYLIERAIWFLIQDYYQNGENSLIAKDLEKLDDV